MLRSSSFVTQNNKVLARQSSSSIASAASLFLSLTSLNVATTRGYFHNIGKDLVPEGMRASRFQSSITPRQRMQTQVEYGVLSPAFGGSSAGDQFPLATLAVSERVDGQEFAERYRKGLAENLSDASQVDRVVNDVLSEMKLPEAVKSVYRKNNRYYEITIGLTLPPENTPWAAGNNNREVMKRELPLAAIPSFERIHRKSLGVEVYLHITTSRNKWRRSRKVSPENWIEPQEDLTNQETAGGEATTTTTNDEASSSPSISEEESRITQAEIDLEIFSRCQKNILRAVNLNKVDNDISFLLQHNVVCAIPGGLPDGIESVPEQYGGVAISEQNIDNAQRIWKDRIERFS